jgi:hypothetical protein
VAREFVASFRSVGAEKLQRDFAGISTATGKLDKSLTSINDTGVRTQRRMTELGESAKSFAKVAAGLAIGDFLRRGVQSAGDMETAMRGLTRVLGEATATDIQTWIEDNGDALNLSQAAAVDAARGLSVYAKQLSAIGGDSEKFTTDLITMSSELAAFNAADPAEVLIAMQSALRGEFDPLERFGVALTAAKVQAEALSSGLIQTGEDMTNAAKIQATYNLLLEDGAFATGSIADSQGTLSGNMADFQQTVADLATTLGQALLPAVNQLLGAVLGLGKAFGSLPGPIRTAALAFGGLVVARKLLGNQITLIGQSLTNLRTELGKTQGAGAKFKAGFGSLLGVLNPWTLALTAGVTLLGGWIAKNQDAAAAAEEWAAGIDAATGALNEQGKALLVKDLAEFTDEAKAAGISIEELAAVVGDTASYDKLVKKLESIRDAGHATEDGGRRIRDTWTETARGAKDLLGPLDDIREKYEAGATQAKLLEVSSEGIEDALSGQATSAQEAAEMVKRWDKEMKAANADIKDLLDNLSILNQEFITNQSAVVDYERGIDDLAKSLKDAKTFSPETEEGRTNFENLASVAEAANERVVNAARRSAEEGREAYRKLRADMIRELTQALGGTETAANQARAQVDRVLKKPVQVNLQLEKITAKEIERHLAQLRKARAKVKAEFEIPPGTPEVVADSMRDGLARKLKPFNVKIAADKKDLDKLEGDVDKAIKPKKQKIEPVIDPVTLAAYEATMARLTATETKTIKVHMEENPTGATLDPASVGRLLGATRTMTLSVAPTPTQATKEPQTRERIRLAPAKTPVQVFLDGQEIATHLELKARQLAAVGTGRRTA